MKPWRTTLALVGILAATVPVAGSGPLGIYANVDKIVVEPSESAPERIQVWGAFAYVDQGSGQGLTVSPAKRGYMYFRMDPSQADAIKKEWADLKAVAGTGQAIGFGRWGYIGAFPGLQPDTRTSSPPYILERAPNNPVCLALRRSSRRADSRTAGVERRSPHPVGRTFSPSSMR